MKSATLLLLVLAACMYPARDVWVGSAPARTTPDSGEPPATTRAPERAHYERVDVRALATRVLAEANVARRDAGAPLLRYDAALTRAAQSFGQELASRQELDHESARPGRRTFRGRLAQEGARARLAGENLARMTATTGELPSRVVGAWLRSPGHRSNLLDRGFVRTGIGIAYGADGVWYIVQEYATGI